MNERLKNIYDDLYKTTGDDLSTELSKVQQELSEIFDGTESAGSEKQQEQNGDLPEKPGSGPQPDMDKPAQEAKEAAAQEAQAQADPEPETDPMEELDALIGL